MSRRRMALPTDLTNCARPVLLAAGLVGQPVVVGRADVLVIGSDADNGIAIADGK